MANSLVIVESPTKVKTIKKFLGADFNAVASMGHIKDLPKSKLGIDLEKDFEPTYNVIETKKKTIDDLKKAARNVENIYLAPDPDREGEAIAWHIAEVINTKNKNVYRVLFNDLTKDTVTEAIKNPLQLDFNKYEAQQTRRILDRLVGYQISPVLWEKVKRGLSAGRVQSVAVRMICDREEEINKFVPEEYWNLIAQFEGKNPPPFEAKLIKIEGRKAKVTTGEQAAKLAAEIKQAEFIVEKLEKKAVKRSAPPPFTTSKLQQEASRWLRFSAKKTMMVAQKLYEGIELGQEGSVGLITYMRTDSYRIAEEALKEVRDYIKENYSSDYLPHKPHLYKNAQKAQDAHEAIRPSKMSYNPRDIKGYLTPDQFKLYQLIWNRFVASQMNPAILDQTTIDIAGANCIFRAQGQVMKFPGFTIVYTEGKDEKEEENGGDKLLPEISEKEKLKLLNLNTEQKFTQPPPRFSEASLVRELEEKGIGRPSTYATILSTIQDREYVRLEKGKFYPSELGMTVTRLLIKSFPSILDLAFTADMENKLDAIENGERKRVETLKNFYELFDAELKKAKTDMENIKTKETPTDLICEKCDSPMVIKWGKNGKFLCCSNYPKCKNTMNFTHDENGKVKHVETITTDVKCNKCGKPMIVKEGRFGQFLACSGYPECKNTMNATKNENGDIVAQEAPTTDEVCELCGKPMAIKRGRYGQFLGCTGYPECKNIKKMGKDGKVTKAEPVLSDENCDLCGKPMAIKRGRYGQFLGCTGYPECKNIKKMSKTQSTE
ncbi:MAG: type I DNA topoisomerase [Smithella sp.]|nr:type I DNA topoisomerase [Smithella sp.]MDM7988627.1 type I DNA topoisomerase [Smithella sp.]HOU51372.1 type I DNA topoisomerase [Smithella sp.]HQH16968.1 type I DNA topoisomerase [Smithella sp.]HQI72636.1 type I DNA topoisomerase [Smithella sp.]